MSLKYWILIMFVIAVCSRSSAQRCSKSYIDGKWISEGDCGDADMMSGIMSDLKRRSEEEKKKTWTVFQRRKYGDVDFYRGWDDYVKGFGDRDGDFWLGLEEMHVMTKDGDGELEINMIPRDKGTRMVAKYNSFRIGPGSDFYRLRVSGYSGNATYDALYWHNNHQFTTKDADHDSHPSLDCASDHEGGWWYWGCAHTNLNGNFNETGIKGIWWIGPSNRLRFSEMKIRRRP